MSTPKAIRPKRSGAKSLPKVKSVSDLTEAEIQGAQEDDRELTEAEIQTAQEEDDRKIRKYKKIPKNPKMDGGSSKKKRCKKGSRRHYKTHRCRKNITM